MSTFNKVQGIFVFSEKKDYKLSLTRKPKIEVDNRRTFRPRTIATRLKQNKTKETL